MRGVWGRRLLPLLLGLLAALAAVGAAGCTRAVAGTPAAAPPPDVAVTATPGSVATGTPTSSATPDPGPAALQPDVLADECLLDARELTALLGRPIGPPQQATVPRADGSRSSSCYAGAAAKASVPRAAINVYRVRSGTPAEFVRTAAPGRHALAGIGAAAAVLDTVDGVVLQVASGRFLVTVAVQGRGPDDDAWRAAARAALARLPV